MPRANNHFFVSGFHRIEDKDMTRERQDKYIRQQKEMPQTCFRQQNAKRKTKLTTQSMTSTCVKYLA